MRRYALYIAAVAYAIGVVCGYYVHITLAITAVALGIALTAKLFLKNTPTWILILLVSLAIGSVRMVLFQLVEIDHGLDQHIGIESSCDGVVVDPPKVKGEKVFATVLHDGSRISVSSNIYRPLAYGDLVECTGVIQKTDMGSDWRQRIFYRSSAKEIRVLEQGQASSLLAMLYSIKDWFVGRLYDVFPSPHGELIAGLTIEGADVISKTLKDQFKRTSLSHIVALSGTNVSIIVEAVFIVLQRFRRGVRFTGGFAFIILFALMTGLTSTILRASLMAMMSLGAEAFHRTYNPLRALLISSICMLLFNPLILLFDISFQLSFMATLSMILIVPVANVFAVRFIRYETIRETLVTTMSAQVLVLPLILFYSGSLSVIAPISNLLVLPFIPPAMLFGSLAVVASYLGPVVYIVSLPAQIIVSYILFVVETLSSLPFAAYTVQIPWFILILMYVAIVVALFYACKRVGVKPVL